MNIAGVEESCETLRGKVLRVLGSFGEDWEVSSVLSAIRVELAREGFAG